MNAFQRPFSRVSSERQGFSLLELLTVIAVIALLVALLVPAVQQVREAARKTQCRNNLRQIGLALEGYHDLFRTYPPAAIRSPGDENNGRDRPRSTWTLSLLPHLEMAPLYQRFDASLGTDQSVNSVIREAVVASYRCPTDTGADVRFEPRLGITYQRGNYGANFGAGSWGTDDWGQKRYRGVMGQNAALKHAEMTDGASQTVSVAELRIQASPRDNRGVWAFPAPGSASVGLDCDSLCRSINGDSGSDWIPFCDPVAHGLQCAFQNDADSNAGPRSQHSEGAHLLFCDGSVRFVAQVIDQFLLNAAFTSQNQETVGDF